MKHTKYLFIVFLLVPALVQAQFLFQDVTMQSGIFMQTSNTKDVGPGVVVFDLDGDGWDDLYLPGGLDSDKLYLNMHDGTFKNVTTNAFAIHDPQRDVFPRGGSAFDYDNDGLPDIYTCDEGRDILWHNNGDGTFSDRTRFALLNFPLNQNESNSSTFGDFNGDGFNDLYVARWTELAKFKTDGPGNDTGYAHKGFPNWFYVNNGNGTFTDRGKEFGVDGDTGNTNIALFFDYDRDGDLDLLIGNDFGVDLLANRVYKNMLMETGKATFVRVDTSIGLETHLFCMGIGPNDYNRDGNFDFYETSIGTEVLMKNNGDNTFTDVSSKVLPGGKITPSSQGYPAGANGYERHGSNMTTTWTALFGDFDNDGFEDAMIVHGYEGGIPPWIADQNRLDTTVFFHNNLGNTFDDVTDNALVDRFGKPMYLNLLGRGAAYLDFNHDGKVDLCFATLGGFSLGTHDARLLKNITPDKGTPSHWLEMRFTAIRTAKEAIGTIVDVWAGGAVRSRQVSTGGGFGSQNSLMQHVGLGKFAMVDSVIVYWPCDKDRNRTINKYYHVAADQILHYTEDTSGGNGLHSAVAALAKNEIQVYPSPARNVINVQNLDASITKRFEIFDMLGIRQIDVKGSESNLSLSIGNLRPGCYMLRVTTERNTVIKRFIKE